jgi:AbrB family looped-hinge helix DNA binding protein
MDGLFRGQVHGSATVGARGQVVIPAEIRESPGIRPGDRLIVFVRPDRNMLGLTRAQDFTRMLAQASRRIFKFKRKASRRNR